jgi:hypothetical protein
MESVQITVSVRESEENESGDKLSGELKAVGHHQE